MKQDSTILQFPKSKIVREILPESEELKRLKTKNTQNFADTLVQDISEEILVALSEVGLDTDGKEFNKDFHFFVGTLQSMIYRSLSIDHHLHSFVDENVKITKIKVDDIDMFEKTLDGVLDKDE